MLKKNIDQILKIVAILSIGISGIYIFAVEFKPIYVIVSGIFGLVLWLGSYVLSNKNKTQKSKKESRIFNTIINMLIFVILFIIFAIISNK